MFKYLLKRTFQMVFVLFIVSVIVFTMTSVIGNPVYNMLPQKATDQQIQEVVVMLGLDKPLYVQYWIFLKNAIRGEFGRSYTHFVPALGLIVSKFPATIEIVIVAMGLTILLGISLGVLAGARPKSKISKLIMFGSLAGISLPSFFMGMVYIFVFAVSLRWLPVSGRGEIGTILGIRTSLATLDGWRHIILPSMTLALLNIATIIRLVRAGMMEVMRQDFIKFARSKGVAARKVLYGHALKNILIPVVTIFGLQLGELIAFTTITETIFAWPGMGKLLIDSITNLDRPIISAYLLFVAILFVVINFVVDILYTFIDPRIDLNS
ncbi:MAG: ABC transporter permease [Spirochaetales bacterium]|nr:ABC transporter permease [Spirochaetales bacterium]